MEVNAMRYSRGCVAILSLLLFLGLFFQFHRTDGFLRLFKNTNTTLVASEVKEQPEDADNWPREKYLVVCDVTSGDSIKLRLNLEKTFHQLKKDVKVVSIEEAGAETLDYTGVFIAFPNLDRITNIDALRNYVFDGGKVYFMITPSPGNAFMQLQQELGFKNSGKAENTTGVKILSSILIKGKGFELNGSSIENSSMPAELDDSARVHITSFDDTPLLWDKDYGKGAYVIFNGTMLGEKGSRGIITGMLGLSQNAFVYPIIGTKTMYIDDFPAPAPEGIRDEIYPDYHLTTAEFYRQIWWPGMLKIAAKYDIRYTGLAIETYNANVAGPFDPESNDRTNRRNLILYGRELLKSGGEIGIHGYNHQPLVPEGYAAHNEEYTPWENPELMAQSMSELKRYLEVVYPDYKFKSYVPPSNILSPEGRAALKEAMPDLKMISSLYIGSYAKSDSYIQEYGMGPDGILNMPRISADYLRDKDMDWDILNAVSFLGVFSHFVHPDNLLFAENKGIHWRDMYKEFESLMKEVYEKYGWLRSCTGSQSAEYYEDFLQMDYRIKLEGDQLQIACWGFSDESYFILRTPRKVTEAKGCEIQSIDENIYLLKIHSPEVTLSLKSSGL
jgi:hypothetical protein